MTIENTQRLARGLARARGFVALSAALLLTWTLWPAGDAPTTRAQVPAVPNTHLQYGFVMGLLQNNALVRTMGYQWVSYGIYWMDAEPSPGQYNWGHVDNVVTGAQAAGVNVLIRISRPPSWARDPACRTIDTCPPADPGRFGSFANALAAHVASLPHTVQIAYEIWNEPNISTEWGGLCPEPARYAGLLRAGYPGIKAADPSAIVVAGAVTTVGERLLPLCHLDDITFLEGMYSAGAAPYFDVLSDHPYGFASPPEADPVGGPTRLVFRRAEQHRQLMVQFGDAAKQIWATEMGWPIDPRTEGMNCPPPDWYFIFNPQQQADYLVRAHQWARSYWPWMGVMFTFNFDFKDAPWYPACHAFRFWSVKDRPAQAALASFARTPPPTYTPVVDSPPAIQAVRYSQLAFSREGGVLTVQVDAADDDNTPVESVQAQVRFPDNSTQVVSFSLVSGTNRRGTWRATINLAPNYGPSVQQYVITPSAVEAFPPRRTVSAPSQQITVANTRFWDVPQDHWAHGFVDYLAERQVISGYSDGTFRPNNLATRAQLSKIVVLAFGYTVSQPPTPHFADVPADHPFYAYVEAAFERGLISGYNCGSPGEPCDPQNRPYFRPANNITRSQISKIVVLAAGWPLLNPPAQQARFQDVPYGSPFYLYVETAAAHEVLSGYDCGSPGEPCDPQNRPYFRPGNNATRAQISKMVHVAITQQQPAPTPAR